MLTKILPAFCLLLALPAHAEVPASIVADGVPEIAAGIKSSTVPYMEFRAASFLGWNDATGAALVATRFGNTAQLHEVKMPGGARTQLTFAAEPIAGGSWQAKTGGYLFYVKDNGGDEYFQGYRLDQGRATPVLLTDGKSRNGSFVSNKDGSLVAYASTRRTGKDTDIYLMDPRDAKTDRLILERSGGGWGPDDISPDGKQLLIAETISINESNIYLVDTSTKAVRQITPPQGKLKAVYSNAKFAPDGTLYVITDAGSEYRYLAKLDAATGKTTPVSTEAKWDVEEYQISDDGSFIAYTVNMAGSSRLMLMDRKSGVTRRASQLPDGVISRLDIAPDGTVGFTLGRVLIK